MPPSRSSGSRRRGQRRTQVAGAMPLSALPVVDEVWYLATRPAVFMIGRPAVPTVVWIGVVATEDGFARTAHMEDAPFHVDSLMAVVERACSGAPVAADPVLPRLLLLEAGEGGLDEELVEGLAERLAPLGVAVELWDVDPALDVLHAMSEEMGNGSPVWLAEVPEDEFQTFLGAAQRFFEAAPWRWFETDDFVAFRVGEGPWRYLLVMGQGGEEFGLTLFRSIRDGLWFHDEPLEGRGSIDRQLRSLGWLETFSLSEVVFFSPLDGGRYLQAAGAFAVGDLVPVWMRLEPEGPALPEQSPGVYAALLEVLADSVAGARGPVAPFSVQRPTIAGLLQVVFPAPAEEPVGGA